MKEGALSQKSCVTVHPQKKKKWQSRRRHSKRQGNADRGREEGSSLTADGFIISRGWDIVLASFAINNPVEQWEYRSSFVGYQRDILSSINQYIARPTRKRRSHMGFLQGTATQPRTPTLTNKEVAVMAVKIQSESII